MNQITRSYSHFNSAMYIRLCIEIWKKYVTIASSRLKPLPFFFLCFSLFVIFIIIFFLKKNYNLKKCLNEVYKQNITEM